MRIITALNFLVLIGVFFLPWVDIRCEAGDKKESLYYQSGMEAATGEVSEGQVFKDLAELGNAAGKRGGAANAANLRPDFLKDKKIPGAPLMFVYVGILGAGLLASLFVPKGGKWRAGVLICILLAVGVLAAQTAMGFPIADKAREERKDDMMINNPGGNLFGGPPKITANFMVGYYLSWLFGFTCLMCVPMDIAFTPKPRKQREYGPDSDQEGSEDNPFG